MQLVVDEYDGGIGDDLQGEKSTSGIFFDDGLDMISSQFQLISACLFDGDIEIIGRGKSAESLVIDADALDSMWDINLDFAYLLHLSDDAQHPDVEHKASLGGDDFDEGSNFAVLVNFLGAFEIGGKIRLQ